MTHPVRLQLSRKKGFYLQVHSLAVNGLPAINVARPSKWGNPFCLPRQSEVLSTILFPTGLRLIRDRAWTQDQVVTMHRSWIRREPVLEPVTGENLTDSCLLKQFLPVPGPQSIEQLIDQNLACWCVADANCHADNLLELANG